MNAADNGVTQAAWTDIADLLAPGERRRQELPGFDPEYVDIVDYIIRITHRIWEEKNVGLVHRYYSDDALIHTLAGEVRGAEEITRQTTRMLAAFPDRSLYGDSVVWSEDEPGSFYTSHRITSHLTHLGHGDLGPPTGRRAAISTIADCRVRENRIFEEWLMRDSIGLLLQLGFDPHAIARQQAAQQSLADDFLNWRESESRRVMTSGRDVAAMPASAQAEPIAFATTLLQRLINAQLFGEVERYFAFNCDVRGPSGRRLFGHGEVIGNLVSLLAAFPDATLCVDHACANPGPEPGEIDIALRWMLAGHNSAPSFYGAASGKPVLVLGGTHWRLVGERITEEWTVFDELAVLRQIYGG